jgi:hypothetical protein
MVANVLPEQRLVHVVGRGTQYLFNISNIDSPCLLNDSTAAEVRGSPGLILTSAPGVDMHPGINTLVGFAADGAGVYFLNRTTFRWKYIPPAPENSVIPMVAGISTFSRWRYVPDYDVFVYAPAHNAPVYFYKLGPPPAELCDIVMRPQQPYPDAWDCVNGTWTYVSPLFIPAQTNVTISSNVTIVGNLGLNGKLVVVSTATVEVTGCIVLANGSSIDLKMDQLSFEEAKALVGSNISLVISSTKCIQNPSGLSGNLILIATGSTACQEISGAPVVDTEHGSLTIVFVSSGAQGCLPENLSAGIPTWAIGVIVAVAVVLVAAAVAVLTVPALRERVIPSYKVKSQLRAFMRNSVRVEEAKEEAAAQPKH